MTAFGRYLASHCADLFRAGCRAHFLLWQSAAIPALDGPCGEELTRAGVVEYMGSVQVARCVLEDDLSVSILLIMWSMDYSLEEIWKAHDPVKKFALLQQNMKLERATKEEEKQSVGLPWP
jgi:hypothetical protein